MVDWFVYMLECNDKTLYTGISPNPLNRFKMHQMGKGAKYTRGRGPFTLRYLKRTASKGEALSVECYIKQLSRSKKLHLIKESHRQTSTIQKELMQEEA